MEISSIFNKTKDEVLSSAKFSGKVKSQILSFNTDNADKTSGGTLKWNIVNTKNYSHGDVNTSQKLYNIIGLRLHPFRLRSYDVSLSPSLPRWYIGIHEFANQSFLHNDNSFHFISSVDSTNVQGTNFYTEMQTYSFNQGYYWFNDLVKIVDSITLDIYNVFGKLNVYIPSTQITVSTVVQNSNPLTFSMTNSNIRTGDVITIAGFTTGDPVADAVLINSVNNYQNYIYVGNLTAYINIDASAMVSSGSPINITITTVPYTLLFPIEFIYYD